MSREKSLTEELALAFIEKAKELDAEVEPIRVLRARAYKILNANMLIRASTLGKSKRYFFGLNYIHVEEVANLENAFFVFICGSLECSIILPADILINHLPLISHDRNGEYKINIDTDLNLILNGRKNRLNCNSYVNAWDLLRALPDKKISIEESYHSILQGRLLEIGNMRGYYTFCPNKSKKFNKITLSEIATLQNCPELQFSDYNILRQIDVLWFREKNSKYIPECGFEIEISTGTWSGVGRLATLLDYSSTQLYVISDELRKYQQVIGTFSDYQLRYKHIPTYLVGELYAAERRLRDLRQTIGL